MSSDPANISNCKNCNYPIDNYNFCPNCGAKKITKRITFKNLILEFAARFLNLDNSFIRTFTHLFTQPEVVIGGYINGLRKRYINAFGYFAISVTITGIYSFLVKDQLIEIMKTGSFSEQQIEVQGSVFDFTFQYQSIFSFLLIPLLGIISRVVFLNYKKYNLAEHFVIYLYAYSHIVAAMALILLPITFWVKNFWIVTMIQFPVYILYIAYVLKRLYAMSLKSIIIKTLLFLVIGGFFYVTFSLFIVIVMVLTGAIDFSEFKPQS